MAEIQSYTMNFGPQHPAAHGVLRLVLELDGETVIKAKPLIGYLHTGMEKQAEYKTYTQSIPQTDRMDYLSAHINNEAVCLTVEKALELEVTDRVKVIRTIVGELTRLASHMLWWGVMGMDLGALTTYFYAFRDRELINDIFEETCGLGLALEHNGDLYSCDHYVEPKHRLGNIIRTDMIDLVRSPNQQQFGRAKLKTLPEFCRECDVRFACNGGCPKNRIRQAPDGEYGLNYLCEGYKAFFCHIDGPMRRMADALRRRKV